MTRLSSGGDMVSADDFTRSLRGLAAFLDRRPDGLRDFEITEPGFWRSFAAIVFTLPAFVVELALERRHLRLGVTGPELLSDLGLAATVAVGHVLSFLALPVGMILVARRLGLGERCVPFVIVTNWLQVFGSLALALPGALLLAGWETPPLAALFTLAFAIIVLHVQWFATRVTLQVGGAAAASVTAAGLVLSILTGAMVEAFL